MKIRKFFTGLFLLLGGMVVGTSCGKDADLIEEMEDEYELVDIVFEEIERASYYSADSCTLSYQNLGNMSKTIQVPDSLLFPHMSGTSLFESSNPEAFTWMPEEGVQVMAPSFMLDDHSAIGWDNRVVYTNQETQKKVSEKGSTSVVLIPGKTTFIRGKYHTYKRKCKYTLTIENTRLGMRTKIDGIWTQTIPLGRNISLWDE